MWLSLTLITAAWPYTLCAGLLPCSCMFKATVAQGRLMGCSQQLGVLILLQQLLLWQTLSALRNHKWVLKPEGLAGVCSCLAAGRQDVGMNPPAVAAWQLAGRLWV